MFLSGLLIARATSQHEYGTYVLIMSLVVNIQGLHKALVDLPFTVLSPRCNHAERRRLLGNSSVYTVVYLVLAVLTSLIAGSAMRLATSELTDIAIAACLTLIPFVFREHFRSTLLAQLMTAQSVMPNIVATLVLLASVLVLHGTGTLGAATGLAALGVSTLIAGILMFCHQRSNMEIDRASLVSGFLKFWETGKWNALNIFWHISASQIYPWLVLYFLDAAAVGVYGACFAVASVLTPLLRGITAFILPRMAHSLNEHDTSRLSRITKFASVALSVPFGLWVGTAALLGDMLMAFFYSHNYAGYGYLVQLLVLRIFIEAASTPLTSALQALQMSRAISASLVAGSAVTLTLGVWLVSTYGLLGAGIATVISSFATGIYKYSAFAKRTKSRDIDPPPDQFR